MKKTGQKTTRKRIWEVLLIVVLFAAIVVWDKRGQSDKEMDVVPLPPLVIGSDDYEPYNYLDSNGNPAGIDVEIAKEVCRRLGYTPVFKQIIWENKDTYLEKQEVDCLWGCFTMSGREEKYEWAGPYLYSRQVAAVSKDSGIHSFADLEGKRVAVQATTRPEQIILSGEDERIPEVSKVYSLSTMEELYASLRKGYTDAIMGHESALGTFVKACPEQFEILPESLYRSSLGVAFQKNTHVELAAKMTQTFQKMRIDGTIQKIVEKYGLNVDETMVESGEETGQ